MERCKPTSLSFRYLTYKIGAYSANVSYLSREANKIVDGRVPKKLKKIIKGKLLYYKRGYICATYITIRMCKTMYIVSIRELHLVLRPHGNGLGGGRKPKPANSE